MISQKTVEQIKELPIQDVISKFIELKKNGANYKACCPFHGEKTASFVVSPSKQIYHCFGCGVGGDAIKFVQDLKNFNFEDAIRDIADMFGISIITERSSKYDNDILARYNSAIFISSLLPEHKTYLHSRDMTDKEITEWDIGFAPNSQKQRELASEHLFLESELIDHGIFAQDKERIYPMFNSRITIPIYNEYGHLVGWSGRYFGPRENIAKYLNSPQSKVFDKSSILFGLHKAKQEIRKKREVIIVEGQLDVILSHKAGFTNTVATQGTALTSKHITTLMKYNDPHIILVFDGDKAGLNAAVKAATLITQNKLSCAVAIMPEGLDPADAVKLGRVQEYETILSNATDAIRFVLLDIINSSDLTSPRAKKEAFSRCIAYLKSLDDPIIANEYKHFISIALGVDIALLDIKHTQKQDVFSVLQKKSIELDLLYSMMHDKSLIYTASKHTKPQAWEQRRAYEEILKEDQEQNIDLLRHISFYETRVLNQKEFEFGCKMLQKKFLNRMKQKYKHDISALSEIQKQMKGCAS